MGSSTGMPCQELVELVTAYLDGALPGAERTRCDGHLRTCPGCRGYVAQTELVVSALGDFRRADLEENPAEKARLLDLFRTRSPPSRCQKSIRPRQIRPDENTQSALALRSRARPLRSGCDRSSAAGIPEPTPFILL